MVLFWFLMGDFGFSPWILGPSELFRSSTEFCVFKYDLFGLRLKQTININAEGYSLKLPARFIPISFSGLSGFIEVDFLYLWKAWHQVFHLESLSSDFNQELVCCCQRTVYWYIGHVSVLGLPCHDLFPCLRKVISIAKWLTWALLCVLCVGWFTQILNPVPIKSSLHKSEGFWMCFVWLWKGFFFSKYWFLKGKADSYHSGLKVVIQAQLFKNSFALQDTSHCSLILINMIDNSCFIQFLGDSFLRHNHFVSWRWDPLVCISVCFPTLLLC